MPSFIRGARFADTIAEEFVGEACRALAAPSQDPRVADDEVLARGQLSASPAARPASPSRPPSSASGSKIEISVTIPFRASHAL